MGGVVAGQEGDSEGVGSDNTGRDDRASDH